MLFQKARKFLLRRSEPDLLTYPELSQLCTEMRHLLQTRMVGPDEALLEIQKLTGLAAVKRLHPARFQIHFDPVLSCGSRFPSKSS